MGAGFLAMALSTITLHMLTCGFILCEIFNSPTEGWWYRLAMLAPAIGVLGVVYRQIPFWVGVFTSSIAFLLIPVVYIGIFILHNRADYLGEENRKAQKRCFGTGRWGLPSFPERERHLPLVATPNFAPLNEPAGYHWKPSILVRPVVNPSLP